MAVSFRKLLDDTREVLEQHRAVGVSASAAADAAAGLAAIGRALDLLYGQRPYVTWQDESRPSEAAALIAACADAARGWAGQGGRVADLLGATADAASRHARTFTAAQLWALTEAFAVTARRCIDTGRQFPPYAHIPALDSARSAAIAVERRASLLPTAAADRTALDRMVPGGHLTRDPSERVIDAAVELHHAITGHGYYPRLCMAELLITVNAAHLATTHAASFQPPAAASAAAPQAWRAARIECASFDDGTKLRPPQDSKVAAAAARLGRQLVDQFGAKPQPAVHRQDVDATAATMLHTVTQLLPDIAAYLGHATQAWAAQRTLLAPERRLLAYEDRNDIAIRSDGVDRAEREDLHRLNHALTLSESLTTALARDLGQVLPPEAARQPHLRAALTATAGANRFLSIQAQSAHDALRRAQALNPSEWALPTTPPAADVAPKR